MNNNVFFSSDLAPELIPENFLMSFDDVENAINSQRPFFIPRWMIEDVFKLYEHVAICVKNINSKQSIDFKLIPVTDDLKKSFFEDEFQNTNYFVLSKENFYLDFFRGSLVEHPLYSIYYFVQESIPALFIFAGTFSELIGSGEEPPLNGVRIPKGTS